MTDDLRLLELELPQGPESARQARRAVASAAPDARAVDRLDLAIIASELTASMAASGTLSLTVLRTAAGYRIEAVAGGDRDGIDDLSARVLDELASDWATGPGSVWAEITTRTPLPDEQDDETLIALAAAGDDDARAELAKRYAGLARSIAGRFTHTGLSRDDLEQVAHLGLLHALDRFDPDRGVRITTFAARTIEGELKRHLRDHGWSLRVPRGLQEIGMDATRAQAGLEQEHGRKPRLEEVAEIVGEDPDDVARALLARRSFSAASLDAPVAGADTPRRIDRIPSHDDRLPLAPEWADVSEALDHLDERDRRIIYLRFFEDLSQSEIAGRIGISQMHVSRLLSRSLPRLRRIIEGGGAS